MQVAAAVAAAVAAVAAVDNEDVAEGGAFNGSGSGLQICDDKAKMEIE